MARLGAVGAVMGLLAGLWLAAAAWSQEDMEVVATDMFTDPRRPAAVFPHDSHNESAGVDECNVCHHIYNEDGTLAEDESSEDQACADCHESADVGRQPGLMKAYHLNCKGCHQEQAAGPVTCGECHIK